ncbi:AMP-binding protein [Nocardia sp. NPDC050793]|uniref:AMP-binding protein n=1 Tax=Nocardia sp. NPDC050793 TaxID=3155159 RepID=UPI0033CD3447
MSDDVILSGPALRNAPRPLDETIRTFDVRDRGISFLGAGGRERVGYADLAARSAVVAKRLHRHGVDEGDMVAVSLSNDLGSVLVLLGIWTAGATAVSLPPRTAKGSDWYVRRFSPVLRTMGCEFVVVDEVAGADPAAFPELRSMSRASLVAEGDDPRGPADWRAPDTALIQFTSGSVGLPKGVAISAFALAAHLESMAQAVELDGDRDRVVSWLPLYHDMGLVAMFMAGLSRRAEQVLAPPATFALQPGSWLAMLAAERATITAAPSFAYRLAAGVAYESPLDLSSVRLSINGGERIDWQTLLDFHAVAGPMGFRWEAIAPAYGLAEGTVAVTLNALGRGPVQGPDGHVALGRPLPGVEVQTTGESSGPVWIRGMSAFSGYHTENGFVAKEDEEWFDTGDDGFTADGELFVVGRRAEVLSVGGRNIFAEDIESVTREAARGLVHVCAAFRNAAQDQRFGLIIETDPSSPEGQASPAELAKHVRATVTRTLGTRLTPILVVSPGTIPRTTSGKVQRSRCRTAIGDGKFGARVLAELT